MTLKPGRGCKGIVGGRQRRQRRRRRRQREQKLELGGGPGNIIRYLAPISGLRASLLFAARETRTYNVAAETQQPSYQRLLQQEVQLLGFILSVLLLSLPPPPIFALVPCPADYICTFTCCISSCCCCSCYYIFRPWHDHLCRRRGVCRNSCCCRRPRSAGLQRRQWPQKRPPITTTL